MGLIHTWHIHRDDFLRIGGVVMCMASMLIVLSTPHHGEVESQLVGAAFRNVVIGLLVGVVLTRLWRRFYWYERTSWARITPGGVALAGLIAFGLAVALGGPETAVTLASGGQ